MGKLVDAARVYIGVKWRHRGRSMHGLDCAGLGVLAYRDCGVEVPDFTLYGREPHDDGLIKYLTAALGSPVYEAKTAALAPHLQDGDVIVQCFDKQPHHVAIVAEVMYGTTPALNVVHADGRAGRVLEVRLDEAAIARITHVFRKAA